MTKEMASEMLGEAAAPLALIDETFTASLKMMELAVGPCYSSYSSYY